MTLICPPVARRSAAPPQRQWWSRAWQRMVEESRSDETEWMRARRLARSGQLGAIRVVKGRALVATHGPEAAEATLSVGVLDSEQIELFSRLVASVPTRLSALLSGRLELDLVEEAEELGVELIGGFGTLAATCTCLAWHPLCAHALALAIQVGWAMETDAWVLLTLRGMPREALVARVRSVGPRDSVVGWAADSADVGDGETELTTAVEAVFRARRLLQSRPEDQA